MQNFERIKKQAKSFTDSETLKLERRNKERKLSARREQGTKRKQWEAVTPE